MRLLIAYVIAAFLFAGPVQAAPLQPAPPFDIEEWLNGEATSIQALRGRVVIIDFFQLICPGCNKFSIPLMKQWEKTFTKEIEAKRLEVISIHTVFEIHQLQMIKRLKSFLKEKNITHLVGVDRHKWGEWMPETMKLYKTRGTPEIAIIDKKGNIRFQKFGRFDVNAAEKLIRQLLEE